MVSDLTSTLITRNPSLVAAEIEGDLVMMSVDRGEYFGITGVGPRVWELLATPTTVANMARVISTEHAVEESVCQADIQIFVEEMVQLGLVSTS